MNLIRFSLRNFRIFEGDHKIDFPKTNHPLVVVGPNNNGKTSLCEAIQMMMSERQRYYVSTRSRSTTSRNIFYNYERDYPKGIKIRRKHTTFELDIELSDQDLLDIQNNFSVVLPKNKIKVFKEWSSTEKIFKLGVKGIEKESDRVARFILSQFKVIYVPAIRNPEEIENIFRELFSSVVQERINNSTNIKKILATLNKLLEPEINKTTRSLDTILKNLIEDSQRLDLKWDINLSRAVSLTDIRINDGVETSINLKGDGIKSLSLIALLTQLSELKTDEDKKNLILIIEEPEAHLNSSYLHSLNKAIKEFAKNSTVILTTHSPVFVDYYNESNYLISNGTILKPKNRTDIAKCLGVQLNENLISNSLCIILEGEEDKAIFEKIFTSTELKKFKSKFDLIPALGVDNVTSTFTTITNIYKEILVLIDNDSQAKNHLAKYKQNIPSNHIFQIPVLNGHSESEMEDLISLHSLSLILSQFFGREVSEEVLNRTRKRYKGKWSNWMKHFLNEMGLPITEPNALKSAIWSKVELIEFNNFYDNFIRSVRNEILNKISN